ncbi:hypothetical protein EV182_000904 [Spiromyces aspiralis]|uniref:Uncharacterized protein n=1 Tax=Spiromyces aspiralis TaxID=68401 RepID=A0ACC1HH04_9FUNG|nr:hypothetical protein EV182_000904 [Spiromyces aspiralis]
MVKIFVTVGSTGFDTLVASVCSTQFLESAKREGFDEIVVQYGASGACFTPPRDLLPVRVSGFSYSNSIEEHYDSASLIVSHAGSGSILAALRRGIPLVVAINDRLMDNHQRELADALAEMNHLVVSKPSELAVALRKREYRTLAPYPPGNPRPIGSILDQEVFEHSK